MTSPASPSPPPPPPPAPAPGAPAPAKAHGCWFYGCLTVSILLLVIVITALITGWWVKRSMEARPIEPTVLSEAEQVELEEKLERLGADAGLAPEVGSEEEIKEAGQVLPIDEEDVFERKPVIITEREINAMIGHNTDFDDKVKVELRRDRIKVKVNFPVPHDAPFFGGKTFRFNLGAKVKIDDENLVVMVDSVALGGMPLPNAWIMDIKHQNLADEFFPDEESKTMFMAGIEKLEVNDGEIVFVPAE